MEEKKFSIAMADGTSINNLKLNGNNFISSTKITEDQFTGLDDVTIICSDGTQETHEHMALVQVVKVNKEWWFVLRDIGEAELKQLQLQANIEYLAMMADVEL